MPKKLSMSCPNLRDDTQRFFCIFTMIKTTRCKNSNMRLNCYQLNNSKMNEHINVCNPCKKFGNMGCPNLRDDSQWFLDFDHDE